MKVHVSFSDHVLSVHPSVYKRFTLFFVLFYRTTRPITIKLGTKVFFGMKVIHFFLNEGHNPFRIYKKKFVCMFFKNLVLKTKYAKARTCMEASSSSEDWSLMCPNRSRSQMSLRNVNINIFKHLKNYTARKAETILNHTLVKKIKLYSNMNPNKHDWATLENSFFA